MNGLKFAVILLAAGLSACGSSPPVDYYTLQPMTGSGSVDPGDAKIVGLGPITVPGYINRLQLVTKKTGSEVHVDEFNRWAEPLDLALPRVITANVDYLLDNAVVVTFPYRARIQPHVRVLGRIIQFDTNQDGEAVMVVQWTVQGPDAEMLLAPRRSRYTARASPAQDPRAIVDALNETVAAYSRDIAEALRTLL